MPSRAASPATYEDLEAVPANMVAELIDGELVTMPRPGPKHAIAAGSTTSELTGPFQKGRGGPGGWIFMPEPELHFGIQVTVPDIAGWRREHAPAVSDDAFVTQVPDWICEILSPSTARYDRGAKRRIYASAGVRYLWLLDPIAQTLETFVADDAARWTIGPTYGPGDIVEAEPFVALKAPLSDLLGFDEEGNLV
ncbi:MAG: Uma2 family endonuclease [Pseudomonadota bacterium]